MHTKYILVFCCFFFFFFFVRCIRTATKGRFHACKSGLSPHPTICFTPVVGMVGWCEGVVYLTSPGRPTDIGFKVGQGLLSL